VIGHLGEKFLIAHIFDRYEYVPGLDSATKKYIRAQMDYLIGKADICFVAGMMILADNRHLNPNIYFVDHGVDYDHFGKALLEATPVPDDLKKIARPIIGYVGNIEKENVDYELFKYLARQRADWSIVIVGKYHADFKAFADFSNIHLLGRKSYQELPNYLKAFSAAIIPFKISEWIRAVSQPLKLREYLAAGKPVVSTLMPEEEKFQGLVDHSEDYGEFLRLVEKNIANNSPAKIEQRRQSVKNETWDLRLQTIEAHIAAVMAKSRSTVKS
jgi:glycosyltransferase involved in cell wall biosynthesis